MDRARTLALLLCAAGTAWLYHALARVSARLDQAEPTMAGEVLPWTRLMTRHAIRALGRGRHGFGPLERFLGCCAGLFALYAAMLWMARGIRDARWTAIAGCAAALFMGILLCSPVMLSSDTYFYSHYGWLLAAHGADAHAASSIPDPAFSLGGQFEFRPSVYGPLWTVISAGIVRAGGGHVGLTLLLFRALAAVCALGIGGFIWLILMRLDPASAPMGTVLFLWNPLVVIESALSGHNDACMMLLAMLAVWLHLRGARMGAILALAASALVKVITWPLVLLYILAHLRSGGARSGFLLRAGAVVAAAIILSLLAARARPGDLMTHNGDSAQFYFNGYQELIFKALRRAQGETAGSLDAPMDFKIAWDAANTTAALHADITKKSARLSLLKPGQPLLVLSTRDENWVRVFDPFSRRVGFVGKRHVHPIPPPPNAASDPVERRLSILPRDWPTVKRADLWIHIATWACFLAFFLVAAWKTVDFDRFLFWAAAFFLASILLILSRVWPWYLIWPLAYGALRPWSAATRLALLLSAGMIPLYGYLDCINTPLEWLYDYRSLAAVILPVAIFAAIEIAMRLRRDCRPAEACGK
jgi:hypothetical protein